MLKGGGEGAVRWRNGQTRGAEDGANTAFFTGITTEKVLMTEGTKGGHVLAN